MRSLGATQLPPASQSEAGAVPGCDVSQAGQGRVLGRASGRAPPNESAACGSFPPPGLRRCVQAAARGRDGTGGAGPAAVRACALGRPGGWSDSLRSRTKPSADPGENRKAQAGSRPGSGSRGQRLGARARGARSATASRASVCRPLTGGGG